MYTYTSTINDLFDNILKTKKEFRYWFAFLIKFNFVKSINCLKLFGLVISFLKAEFYLLLSTRLALALAGINSHPSNTF